MQTPSAKTQLEANACTYVHTQANPLETGTNMVLSLEDNRTYATRTVYLRSRLHSSDQACGAFCSDRDPLIQTSLLELEDADDYNVENKSWI
jgi:hypothetical protein